MADQAKTYDTWQEALAAVVKKHGLEDSELGDLSKKADALKQMRLGLWDDMKKRPSDSI